ncbi:MAG: trehalose-phosphatase [Kiritimatiellae bacterium]|nr:trehalose-phosphatase [Kiritimatiellia bacterium]MDD5521208.1 trehalose-phosphatase [Kiritimatiellia bacterium]
MEYLFSNWKTIEKILFRKYCFFFFDYDGTLAPIVDIPHKAFLPKITKQLLFRLSKCRNCKVAVISGRSLIDVKKKVGLGRIIYAGNHGLELEGTRLRFKAPVPHGLKAIIQHINHVLAHELSGIPGVFVENKGITVSVHYRLVSHKNLKLMHKNFRNVIKPYIERNQVEIISGKKIYEIKPSVKWGKEKIVSWLLTKHRSARNSKSIFPVYIGDDVADENVFRFLSHDGLSIFVGNPCKTTAQFYLRNTGDVSEFLRRIVVLMSISV